MNMNQQSLNCRPKADWSIMVLVFFFSFFRISGLLQCATSKLTTKTHGHDINTACQLKDQYGE